MRRELLALDPASYEPHPLHAEERMWRETNCAVDFLVEVLHSLGRDPTAGLAFLLGTDFDGDQWRMFKYPAEDLRRLYGVEVDELNVWRSLESHVVEQIDLGRFVALDVDAWYLPDTVGTTYGESHHKTSVVVQMIDPNAERAGYFHNAGYFELEGDDYRGALVPEGWVEADRLPPYTESIRIDRLRDWSRPPLDEVLALARTHLERRSSSNPVARLGKRLEEDLDWLGCHDLDDFHRYAFGTLRQLGANAELLAAFAEWLEDAGVAGTRAAAPHFSEVAQRAKALEFKLARVVSGRSCELDGTIGAAAESWERGFGVMEACCG